MAGDKKQIKSLLRKKVATRMQWALLILLIINLLITAFDAYMNFYHD